MPRTKEHRYALRLRWTGNRGRGTIGYRDYDRAHEIDIAGKPVLKGSADPAFLGDPSVHNPEEWLVASLAACHMLWYLHLCADAGVVVTAYEDHAYGIMEEQSNGRAQFTSVVLEPRVTVEQGSDVERAEALHQRAHELCFIARSVNFPVRHEPSIGEEAARHRET